MDVEPLLFYLFSLVTVVAGALVVTARNPVHSALFLVLTFFSAACIWLLLRAEFLAITLVLVYVGAVMVLFLFVVMMIDIDLVGLRSGFWKNLPLAGLLAAIVVVELVAVLWHNFNTVPQAAVPDLPAGVTNTKLLGQAIYTQYIYPVEIASVLLLVAMVAAIALTLRKRKDTRTNDPSKAVRTKARDRVRVLKMPAVPRESPEISVPAPDAAGEGGSTGSPPSPGAAGAAGEVRK